MTSVNSIERLKRIFEWRYARSIDLTRQKTQLTLAFTKSCRRIDSALKGSNFGNSIKDFLSYAKDQAYLMDYASFEKNINYGLSRKRLFAVSLKKQDTDLLWILLILGLHKDDGKNDDRLKRSALNNFAGHDLVKLILLLELEIKFVDSGISFLERNLPKMEAQADRTMADFIGSARSMIYFLRKIKEILVNQLNCVRRGDYAGYSKECEFEKAVSERLKENFLERVKGKAYLKYDARLTKSFRRVPKYSLALIFLVLFVALQGCENPKLKSPERGTHGSADQSAHTAKAMPDQKKISSALQIWQDYYKNTANISGMHQTGILHLCLSKMLWARESLDVRTKAVEEFVRRNAKIEFLRNGTIRISCDKETHPGQFLKLLNLLVEDGIISRDFRIKTKKGAIGLSDKRLNRGHAMHLGLTDLLSSSLYANSWQLINVRSVRRDDVVRIRRYIEKNDGLAIEESDVTMQVILDDIYGQLTIYELPDDSLPGYRGQGSLRDSPIEFLAHGAIGYAFYSKANPNEKTDDEMNKLYKILVKRISSAPKDTHIIGHYLEAITRLCRLFPHIDIENERILFTQLTNLLADDLALGAGGMPEVYTHAMMAVLIMNDILSQR